MLTQFPNQKSNLSSGEAICRALQKSAHAAIRVDSSEDTAVLAPACDVLTIIVDAVCLDVVATIDCQLGLFYPQYAH